MIDYVPNDKDYRYYAFRSSLPTDEYRATLDRLYAYSPNSWCSSIRYNDDLYEPFDPQVMKELEVELAQNIADPEW